MEVDVCADAEVLAQFLLYVCGASVRLVQGKVAGHAQVHFYRYAVAYAACAQVVYAADAVFRFGNVLDFALHVFGKALF